MQKHAPGFLEEFIASNDLELRVVDTHKFESNLGQCDATILSPVHDHQTVSAESALVAVEFKRWCKFDGCCFASCGRAN